MKDIKTHVIEDATLGGIMREFVEVPDRKAAVGDRILIVDGYYTGGAYEDGDILTVTSVYGEGGSVLCAEIANRENYNGQIDIEEYYVLEPSDTVHIDGGKYRMVDRKAKVGEPVIIIAKEMLGEDHLGKVVKVIDIDGILFDTDGFWEDGSALNPNSEEYRVLEPIIAESTAPRNQDDIIANLAARMHSQERLVSELEWEIEKLRAQSRLNTDDIAMLDERTQAGSIIRVIERKLGGTL